MLPRLSVLLPVYNCEKYLKIALNSLWQQTYQDFEVCIIDDGSTDDSLNIIHAAIKQGYPIKLLEQPHQGIVAALNYGLREAKGSLIARMDADDMAFLNRFEAQVNFLDQYPEFVAVGSWVRFIDEGGSPFFTYKTPVENDAISALLWEGNGGALIHPAVCFRKSALEIIGGYREAYRSVEDLDVYIRLLDIGKLYNLPKILLNYRQHFKSVNFMSPHISRRLLTQTLMDEHCIRMGRNKIIFNTQGMHEKSCLEVYQQWASWAVQEGFKKAAFKYTLKILFIAPFKYKSWAFLKYILSQI